MHEFVLLFLLITANVMGVGMVVPQVIRINRVQSVGGVSIAWIGVGIAMNGWWSAYAVASGLWGLLPVSIGAGGLYLIMTAQVLRLGGWHALRPLAVGAFLLGMVPLPFLLAGGMAAAGVAAGFSYGGQFMPAVAVSLRSTALSGLSPTTWTMAWIEAAIWVIYGTSVDDQALIIGGTGGAAASAIILIRLSSKRRRTLVPSLP
ncbi:MAG: hypothetical protein ACI81L_001639 [Verrucomicrobiales bacterium]|jgi:uncharacterized protein with PQ loop repeat